MQNRNGQDNVTQEQRVSASHLSYLKMTTLLSAISFFAKSVADILSDEVARVVVVLEHADVPTKTIGRAIVIEVRGENPVAERVVAVRAQNDRNALMMMLGSRYVAKNENENADEGKSVRGRVESRICMPVLIPYLYLYRKLRTYVAYPFHNNWRNPFLLFPKTRKGRRSNTEKTRVTPINDGDN